jgi:hypothetical protein
MQEVIARRDVTGRQRTDQNLDQITDGPSRGIVAHESRMSHKTTTFPTVAPHQAGPACNFATSGEKLDPLSQ